MAAFAKALPHMHSAEEGNPEVEYEMGASGYSKVEFTERKIIGPPFLKVHDTLGEG